MALTKKQLKYYQELYKKKKNPPYKEDFFRHTEILILTYRL